jgi:hypothetical protein
MAAKITGFAGYRELSNDTKTKAKKSPISLKRSIGLEHSGATSAKGGSMRVQAKGCTPGH